MRIRVLSVAVGIVLVAGGLDAAPALAASTPSTGTTPTAPASAPGPSTPGQSTPDPSTPGQSKPSASMGQYPPSAFAGSAEALPSGMATAIVRDLHVSPAQYLANSQAQNDAAKVLAALKSEAVPVLSSQIDGTQLSVNVPTAAAAKAVEATGASATVNAPVPTPAIAPTFAAASTSVIGGTGWYYPTATQGTSTSGIECSVGFSGMDKTTGAQEFVTAGHCYTGGSTVAVHAITQSRPADPAANANMSVSLGTALGSTFTYGNSDDSGLVSINSPTYASSALVSTWSGGTGSPATTTSVSGTTAGVVGGQVCKSGSTSGWTCGTILAVDQSVNVTDDSSQHLVNAIVTNVCVLPGDSGGSVLSGASALGIVSGGNFTSCSVAAQSVFYPMVSTKFPANSITGQHPNWIPTLTVPTATLTTPSTGSTVFSNGALSGSLSGAASGANVALYVDGTGVWNATSGATSSFSIPLSAVPAGNHSLVVKVTVGSVTTASSPITVHVLTAPVTINRIADADRYSTAVRVAAQLYGPTHTPRVVYVAAGTNYPDALSAAPAAAEQGGPLLLTDPAAVPAVVLNELQSLNPPKVIVVGGVLSVSDAAYSQIVQALPAAQVTRIGGANRFDTSSQIIRNAFSSAPSVYLASGLNFPDALSATAAAGASHEPVILVPGTETSLDSTTSALLAGLGTRSVTIAGGTAAVTPQLAAALNTQGIATTRMAGTDRFDTSAQVNAGAFPNSGNVYLASGMNFPDALAGSVLAATTDSPLYLAPTTCIPAETANAISGGGGGTTLNLLGGVASLANSVQSLAIC